MFLIDTDVLSALRRRGRSPDVVQWISAQRTTDLYLSVVSVGEVERGIVRQRRRDPAFAQVLAVVAWDRERSEPEYQKGIRCDSWEVVVPELVFEPHS